MSFLHFRNSNLGQLLQLGRTLSLPTYLPEVRSQIQVLRPIKRIYQILSTSYYIPYRIYYLLYTIYHILYTIYYLLSATYHIQYILSTASVVLCGPIRNFLNQLRRADLSETLDRLYKNLAPRGRKIPESRYSILHQASESWNMGPL